MGGLPSPRGFGSVDNPFPSPRPMTDHREQIRLRTIALPVEHGGWGFLFEPIVLAMLVAPSVAGACYAAATISGFLARHPYKLFLRGRRRGSARSRAAGMVTISYAAIAAAAGTAAIALGGWHPVVPLVVLSPLAAVYLLLDTRNRARTLLPELAGPLALAGVAPTIALAAGWEWPNALALWVLLMARTIPSIFYVRARLRLERGRSIRRVGVFAYHLAFLGAVAFLVWRGLAPLLAVAAALLLTGRAALGLSARRRLTKVRQIGVMEIVVGLVYVCVVVIGYRLRM